MPLILNIHLLIYQPDPPDLHHPFQSLGVGLGLTIRGGPWFRITASGRITISLCKQS